MREGEVRFMYTSKHEFHIFNDVSKMVNVPPKPLPSPLPFKQNHVHKLVCVVGLFVEQDEYYYD